MPIQNTSIELIQQAGQTLHRARQALEEDIQASAHLITAAILQSAGKDLDQVFTGIKEVARLAHDLEALEGRLKDLYLSAVSISEHRANRVAQLVASGHTRPAEAPMALVADIQDVEPKTAKLGRRATVAKKAVIKKSGAEKPSARMSNEQKLLAFFKTRLNAKSFTKITGKEISEGAGLPAGSVSAALGKLFKLGALEHKERGLYRWVKGKA